MIDNNEQHKDALNQVRGFRQIQDLNSQIDDDITLMEDDTDNSTSKLSQLTIELRKLLKARFAKDTVKTSDN